MNGALGPLLPAAMTVFVSPMPIVAVLLLLFSHRGLVPAAVYAGGWVLGIGLEVTLFTLLGGAVFGTGSQLGATVGGIVDLVVAATMFALAAVAWHGRPRAGDASRPPRWMSAVDGISPWGALALALVFAIFSPVNLAVTAEAGATIASAGLGVAATSIVATAFVVVGTASITGPVVAFAVARDRVRSPLEAARAWLVEYNAVVLTVLLTVIGADFLGQGIGALWP
ncbi:GAP family protein [Agromyces endophyticus]|uniref:GAP family protein n=1 Tax=Agromyces sp. H17E-10 TaxID=2932244 RepID=UPI001FD5A9A5|nr:GAP family protein [Agromyces sp. H17E-10]UOQ87632.1 GAP family protein [Agromyces sp. H17E-10]